MGITTKRIITKARSSSCSMPGVWRAVAHSKGGVVVYHSPKACSHISRNMDEGDHFRKIARQEYLPDAYNTPLVCSLLEEKHSIFGGADQLHACLEYVIKNYQPKFVMIANSCVVGVIGDDVVSVAKDVEAKFGIPILTVPCYGFLDGEYYAGYYYATEAIINRLVPNGKPKSKSVLLIGDQGGPSGEYCTEVCRLLKYFDIEVLGQFPTYLDYEDYVKVSESSLNIVLGSRGQANDWLIKIADKLEQKFDVPYYAENFPVGWDNTQKWLLGLGELLEQEKTAKIAIETENQKLNAIYQMAQKQLSDKKCVICVGRLAQYFEPGWIINLVRRSGIEIIAIVLLDAYHEKAKKEILTKLKMVQAELIIEQNVADEYFAKADLILTTHELREYKAKQLFLPLLPKSGIQGEKTLLEKIRFLLARRGSKGGIVYG